MQKAAEVGAEQVDLYITAKQMGLKGQVHENVSMMLAVFVTDYTDLALPFSDPTAGGGFVTIVENAGQSKAQGIELETTVAITDDFTIRSAVGYLDSEITEVAEGVQGIGKGDSPALTPRWKRMLAPFPCGTSPLPVATCRKTSSMKSRKPPWKTMIVCATYTAVLKPAFRKTSCTTRYCLSTQAQHAGTKRTVTISLTT